MAAQTISEIIRERTDVYLEWLRRLCSIESVSAEGKGIAECVETIRTILTDLGAEVNVLQLEDANPLIVGRFPGASEKTILFYDHYDVQPVDPVDAWSVSPFQGVERDGLFYARGAADNKGDIVTRLAAIDVLRRVYGALPCNVKFLIEGEEEEGSPNLGKYVERYADLLQADACIWETGSRDPSERIRVSLGLKGLAYINLRLQVAANDLHSGYGAVVEGAANRLVRALAGLRDAYGKILIPGFYDDIAVPGPELRKAVEAIPFEDDVLRERYHIDQFLRERTRTGALAVLLLEPTFTICGIESGYTGPGIKTVLPKAAEAKIEFRLVPDQDPHTIVERLRHHLQRNGFGDVQIELLAAERPYRTALDHPFVDLVTRVTAESTGREVVVYPNQPDSGPMYTVATALQVPVVSLGVAYWDSRMHAPDEHIRIQDFQETIQLIADILRAYSRTE